MNKEFRKVKLISKNVLEPVAYYCRFNPLYHIAQNIKENYGNIEWMLTENGMGVEGEDKFRENGMIQDDYRIDFVKGHLRELHRAIEDGANCKGYLIWTFIVA